MVVRCFEQCIVVLWFSLFFTKVHTAAFQKSIDSDFVIIIYIPHTCLRVCNKHMLFLIYDFLIL